MSILVREFHRSDREQLTSLVNLHVSTVLPGVALSTNVVLSQIEREPEELIVDPWVVERRCLVAVEDEVIVGSALVHRFGDDSQVRDGYRSAADIRWIVFTPSAINAGRQLLSTVLEQARRWNSARVYAECSLPAPGCLGVSDSWPHIRTLLTEAGFQGPDRTEIVLAARTEDLLGHTMDQTEIRRSVGLLGARHDLVSTDGQLGSTSLGYIEVGETNQALARSTTATPWTDVGNLFATGSEPLTTVMPVLLSAAAEWLLLGGVQRLVDYYAEDVHPPEYLAVLDQLGFTRLSTNERGWVFQPG